jgi:uncharacterized protein
MKRIAIVGGGIAGLGCALALNDSVSITLFEAQARLGGHANTVDVELENAVHRVDTGFLVYNEKTYPLLIQLFADLKIEVAATEMSFSFSKIDQDREWCGSSLSSLFAQPSNAWSARFWLMLRDILRFNREATVLAQASPSDESLSSFLKRRRYSDAFAQDYLLPMAAAIWSCPMSTMARFPISSFVRFFHNHGLLQIRDRPQWKTCVDGSGHYVAAIESKLLARGHRIASHCPVKRVTRGDGWVEIESAHGSERFDGVVFACHSDQALRALNAPCEDERELLSAIRYQKNIAYLHRDEGLMPRRKKAWAAWNYLSQRDQGVAGEQEVCVTYWLNRLQPLKLKSDLFLTLNPIREPRETSVISTFEYQHPILDEQAVDSQGRLDQIQGKRQTWFAGAWCGYGFHEDGLKSGMEAAKLVSAHFQSGESLTLASQCGQSVAMAA